ncbi:MAG: hypothetical protein IBX71_02985 [Candidatus Desulforudis sp.]|nr:hypothetical protein [Desulforudis sp.]
MSIEKTLQQILDELKSQREELKSQGQRLERVGKGQEELRQGQRRLEKGQEEMRTELRFIWDDIRKIDKRLSVQEETTRVLANQK